MTSTPPISTPTPDATEQPNYSDEHCIKELRRALRDAAHPRPGSCGPDSTGCSTRHHLASVEALNLLGRGDFALARLLLHEHDTRQSGEEPTDGRD